MSTRAEAVAAGWTSHPPGPRLPLLGVMTDVVLAVLSFGIELFVPSDGER